MRTEDSDDLRFYTVPEAAKLLRVNPVTIYRAIRKDEFPVLKIQRRFTVPAEAIRTLTRDALENHRCIDVADYILQPRSK